MEILSRCFKNELIEMYELEYFLLQFLNKEKSIEYLSIINLFSEEDINFFQNIDSEKKCKIKKIKERKKLSFKEKTIINMLNKDHLKYYLIILYFYINDDDNINYLNFLKALKDRV